MQRLLNAHYSFREIYPAKISRTIATRTLSSLARTSRRTCRIAFRIRPFRVHKIDGSYGANFPRDAFTCCSFDEKRIFHRRTCVHYALYCVYLMKSTIYSATSTSILQSRTCNTWNWDFFDTPKRGISRARAREKERERITDEQRRDTTGTNVASELTEGTKEAPKSPPSDSPHSFP